MTTMPSTAPVLSCLNIHVDFAAAGSSERFVAVDDITLDVMPGELSCLVGPSGCGKSTFLHVIAGLLKARRGRALLDGAPISSPNARVAYLTQRDTLLPWASALDNVLLPIRAAGRKDRDRARQLLALVGLEGFERHFPRQLSGGMRKRVQLARALAQQPRLLLMDEPFGGLDSQTKILIEREFLRIWESERISVVLVTHDLAEAISLADRVYLISRRPARIKQEYPVSLPRPRVPDGVLTDPTYQALYRNVWRSLEEELVAR